MFLFQLPKQVPVANSRTYGGAKAYFYLSGTSTAADVYADALLLTPLSQPVTASSAGVLPAIYLDESVAYKVRLTTSAGTLIYEVDPINEAGVSNGLTAAETSAGLTEDDIDTEYVPGDVRRYGTNTTPGTTDMTAAVAAAVALSGTYEAVFQPETYLTDAFTIPANGKLRLPPGCILKDSGSLGASARLVNITNDNVHIVGWGAKVQMDRADYTSGEQRHGVYIYGAQNVVIEGLESSDCGGDGFYIGGAAGDPATNVLLNRVKADNNRRQGISVVNGRNIKILDPICTNTTGTAPSAGIDIEPNATTDVLEDISIVRPRCTGNDGPGIAVFLAAWNSTSNYCDIDIVEPYVSDNGAVVISGRLRPGIDINRVGSTTPCRGRVRVIDAQCVDENNAGIHVYDWDRNGPLVELVRPIVINPNQAQGSTSAVNGGIIVYNSGTYTTTPGNVRIETPLVRDDDGYLNADTLNCYRIAGAWANTELINPRYAYAGLHPWLIDATASVTVTSDTEIRFDTSNGQTITDWRYSGRTITNLNASGTLTHTLPASVVGVVMDFALLENYAVQIDPNGTEQIVPTGSAGGKYIEASVRGSRVRLRCREAGFWDMENVAGTWSSES